VSVTYDEAKLKELILYVAERLLADPRGGATKINKILFASEWSHMREHGRPITGAEYQKLPKGPAPRALLPVREALLADGDAELVEEPIGGNSLDRLKPLRRADLRRVTDEERRHVDRAIEELWGQTADEVSDLSHREMGWQMVDEGDTIPFVSALLATNVTVTDAMRQRAGELARLLNR
jgi:hypothetical protein